MKIYFRDTKTLSILTVIAIITVSYGLFFYFQSITENQIRSTLFTQQEGRQQDNTRAIASHMEADLALIMSNLGMLAQSPTLQNSEGLLSAEAGDQAQEMFLRLNTDSQGNPSPLIERLFVIDENGIAVVDAHATSGEGQVRNFEGADLSSMPYFQDGKASLAPSFSKGVIGLDGTHKIAISCPIVDESGSFIGLVTAKALAATFFQHYGNIHDIDSQYLAVLDTDSVQLVHPVPILVGTPFFGDVTQETTGRIQVLNDLVSDVMAGQSGQAVYEFRDSERLTTGYPIYLSGEPTYFVFVITPTSIIYADVANTLATQRMETFYLLVITTATIFVLIIFLALWNSNLRDAVKAKTEQLVDSNRQLSIANEELVANYDQLQANEKMQKEFINIAAHELRTPVQPIIGLSDMLLTKSLDPETRFYLETIHRNAMRLLQLSSDILDVTRIESKSMRLTKSTFDIGELVHTLVEETSRQITGGKLQLIFYPPNEKLMAYADKDRILQVLSNLLNNAVKFTEEGTITVLVEKIDDEILVKVIDTGIGIDQEIEPRLFTKFASMSEKGTGLGLFISKSIIDAHGGKIWFENNKDGRGATFGFSLPAAKTPIERPAAADRD